MTRNSPYTHPLRRITLIILATLLLQLYFTPETSHAEKRYWIPEIRIESSITPDGNVQIREHRMYRFDGSFRWASYRLPKRGYRAIQNLRISEGGQTFRNLNSEESGTFKVMEDDSAVEIFWYYEAVDTTRTFTLEYVLEGALVAGPEWVEFFWSWAASQREKSTQILTVDLLVPGLMSDGSNPSLYAWSRLESLDAIIDIREDRIEMRTDELHRSRAFTTRILVPASYFEAEAALNQDPDLTLSKVMQEEEEWLAEIRSKQEFRAALRELAPSFSALIAALSVLFFLTFYRSYGKRQRSMSAASRMRRITPNPMPPALLGRLMNDSAGSGRHLTATIFDLARRGFLRIDEKPVAKKWYANATTEFSISVPEEAGTADRKGRDDLDRNNLERDDLDSLQGVETDHQQLLLWEQSLLHFIEERLQNGHQTFTKMFNANKGGFTTWYRTWGNMLKQAYRRQNWTDQRSYKGAGLNAVLQGGLLIASIVLMVQSSPVMIPAILVSGVLLIGSFAIVRRTEEGEALYQEWKAYRDVLRAGGESLSLTYASEERSGLSDGGFGRGRSSSFGSSSFGRDGSSSRSSRSDSFTPDRHFIYATALGLHGKQMDRLLNRLTGAGYQSNLDAGGIFPWIFLIPGSNSTPASAAASLSTLASTATSSVQTVSGGGGASAGVAGGGASGGAG